VSGIPYTHAAQAPVYTLYRSRKFRTTRALAMLLILSGVLILADMVVTLVWQEPITALIATLRQDSLNSELAGIDRAGATAYQQRVLAGISDERQRIAFLARQEEQHSAGDSPIGRIVIPRIGASFVVVKGTDTEDLKSGPGVYSSTPFPGAAKTTTAIAGHRTTYLAPFRDINELTKGSVIRLEMPYATFIYSVDHSADVQPTDVQAAIGSIGRARLVLSACTPLFSAAERLLVYARLVREIPEGAALRLPGGVAPTTLEPVTYIPGAGARAWLPGVFEPHHQRLIDPVY
jgi:sortase A